MRSGALFYAYLPNLLITSILCTLPLYALCRAIFEPYFGIYKISNSLMLKNMQKNFLKSHPPSPRDGWKPLAPFVNTWLSMRYAYKMSVMLTKPTQTSTPKNRRGTSWNIPWNIVEHLPKYGTSSGPRPVLVRWFGSTPAPPEKHLYIKRFCKYFGMFKIISIFVSNF